MAEDEKINKIIEKIEEKLEEENPKISELEKKYNQLKIRYRESGGLKCTRDRGIIKDRIEKLEAYNEHTFDAQLTENADIIQENKKEISELREMIVKIQNIASEKRVEIRDELTELKERVEGIFMSIHGISDGEKYHGSGPIGGSVPRNIQPNSTPSKCKYLWQQTEEIKRCRHPENTQPNMRLNDKTEGFCTEDKCPLKNKYRKELMLPICDICGIEVIDPIYNLLYLGKKRVCSECFYKEKPPKCEFYNKDYCIPCKSPERFYECEMVKIGNQIKIDKWKTPEPTPSKIDENADPAMYARNRMIDVIKEPPEDSEEAEK